MIRFSALDDRLLAHRPAAATPLGWRCFQLGLFLLASSAFLGGLALLLALILGSRGRRPVLADRVNVVLVAAAVLMVLGCFRAASNGLAWLGMGNWLPFFWGFWGFQVYLGTPAARRRVALALVAGTVPVILTGLGQLWWGWSGLAERPWLGWGAAAFSIIYPMRTGFWHGHPHNLPIDLALSHGVPVAVLVVGLVLWLLGRAGWLGMAGGSLFDRAWWAATLVLVALHATDIPLYDSRVNVAGWVLLAGLRCYRQPAPPAGA